MRAGSNPSFAAWEQNEPYTIALLIKGRSGGASTKHLYRSGTSSTADHILWLSSGTTPNLRHQASSGTVTITSSVAIVNDTTWSTIVGTWRPGRLELYVGRDIVQRAQDGRQWLEPGSAGIPLERSMPVQLTARGVGLAALVILTLKTPPPLIGPALAGEAWTPAILTDPALADVYLPDFSYAGYHWGEEPPPRPPATLDVTDFGAVADDREDDTAAILKAVALANAATEPVVLQFPAGWFILRDILYIKRSDFWVGLGGSWRLVGCPRIARSSCRPCRPARPRADSPKPRKPAARHRHPLPALTSCTFRTRMIRVIDGCNGAKRFELSWVRRELCGKCPSEPERKECLRRVSPSASPAVRDILFPPLISGRNAAECGHSWQIVRTTRTPRYPRFRPFFRLSRPPFSETTEPRPFWYGCWKLDNSMSWRTPEGDGV